MRKIFIILFVFISLTIMQLETFSATNTQIAEISKIENELYGFDYIKDGVEARLSRLEKTIYGKSQNGDINSRLKKITSDIVAEQIGLEIEPTEDTYKEHEEVADSSVNYPVMDEIEMKVFNKTYKNRDFHTRIVTVERELFGKIYDVEDYSTRMDRIKAEVLPEKLAREKVFGYDNSKGNLSSSDLSGLNANRFAGNMPYGQENYTRPYVNYGDFANYANDSTALPEGFEDELAQLEYNTFGTEFSDDDTENRLKRLKSAQKAQKSSQKYDTQKFNQRMSSFMEIGAMLLMILAMVL